MKKSEKILLEKLCKFFIVIIAGYLLYHIFFKRKSIEGMTDQEKKDIYLTKYDKYKDKIGADCLFYNQTYDGNANSTSTDLDSWEKCAKKCKDTSGCKGYTYERTSKKCELFNDISKKKHKYSPKFNYEETKKMTCSDGSLKDVVCTGDTCDSEKLGWTPPVKGGKQHDGPACPFLPNSYKKAGTGKHCSKESLKDVVCTGDTCDSNKLGWTPAKHGGKENDGTHCPYFPAGDDTDAKKNKTIQLAQKACDKIGDDCAGFSAYVREDNPSICFRKEMDASADSPSPKSDCYIKEKISEGDAAPYIAKAKQVCSNIGGDCAGISAYTRHAKPQMCFRKKMDKTKGESNAADCYIKKAKKDKYGIISGDIKSACYDTYKDTSGGGSGGGGESSGTGSGSSSGSSNCPSKKPFSVMIDGKEECFETAEEKKKAANTANIISEVSDQVSGKSPVCICPNGTPATGSDCTTNGATICESCNDGYGHGYGKDADKCVKECKCAYGYPAMGKKCPKKGQQKCVTNPKTDKKCKGTYKYSDDTGKCECKGLRGVFDMCEESG